MRKELGALLCQRYPDIFRDRHGDPLHTCMTRGFECGDGWFDLLDNLCKQITDVVEAGAPPVYANQVKEKFGTLRFYRCGGNEKTDALIDAAIAQSAVTCEQCGATPASMSALGGYYRTRCPACLSALRKVLGPCIFNFYSEHDIALGRVLI